MNVSLSRSFWCFHELNLFFKVFTESSVARDDDISSHFMAMVLKVFWIYLVLQRPSWTRERREKNIFIFLSKISVYLFNPHFCLFLRKPKAILITWRIMLLFISWFFSNYGIWLFYIENQIDNTIHSFISNTTDKTIMCIFNYTLTYATWSHKNMYLCA